MLPKFLFSLVLTALTVLHVSAQHRQEHEVCAIAFYNFENLFDTLDDAKLKGDDDFTPGGANRYTPEVYGRKLHNLATVIRQMGTEVTPDGPALIGTAEIENANVLQDLARQPEIRDRNYRFVHFEGSDFRGIDVALLYHPKYFRVLNARSVPVDLKAEGEDGRTRDILYVEGVLAGDTVHVFVNHWPSRRGSEAATAPKRAIAAGVCRRMIDSLTAVRTDTRIILMGDLNDDPVDASISKILGARGDRNSVKPGGLFNPWLRFYKKGEGSMAYKDAWSLFDQLMLSSAFLDEPSTHWRYHKAEVFNREFLKNRSGQFKGYPHRSFDGSRWIDGYSDHFPVIVYLVREVIR